MVRVAITLLWEWKDNVWGNKVLSSCFAVMNTLLMQANVVSTQNGPVNQLKALAEETVQTWLDKPYGSQVVCSAKRMLTLLAP